MGNIVDFIRLKGGKTFAELPFTPTDAAVLCQLSYLKFEFTSGAETLLDTVSHPERERLFEDDRFGRQQREIYFEAAFSRRYQNMKLERVDSLYSEEAEISYCAMTFRPVDGPPAVVFRGTDEHIVGWKEDFRLAIELPIPSQSMAADYVGSMTEPFYICGHSKGGNLAVYSALYCPPEARSLIKMVYNLDGPGSMTDLTRLPQFSEINVTKLVPERSFVGMLLQDSTVVTVVDSHGPGLLQHMLFNWNTDEFGDFILTGDRPSASYAPRLSEKAAEMSREQIGSFVEALFGILGKAMVEDLIEFKNHWRRDSKRIIEAYAGLDDKTKRLLFETVADLIV